MINIGDTLGGNAEIFDISENTILWAKGGTKP
jgi:hypothetical protein